MSGFTTSPPTRGVPSFNYWPPHLFAVKPQIWRVPVLTQVGIAYPYGHTRQIDWWQLGQRGVLGNA